MECKHKYLTKEQFDKETCQFKNRFDLYYFLLNTLSLITYNGYYYCFCGEEKFFKKKQERCFICQITIIFSDFESDLSKNMFNENFLKDYQSKLYITFKNFLTLIKNRFAVFYMMNTRIREEIGTQERHGVSLSL